MANDGTVKIGVEFENTDKEIAALKSQLSGISKAATTSLTTVTSLTKTAITGTLKAITAAGTAAGGFIAYGTSYNSQIEQFQTSFEVMSGSAQKAAETIETLKKMGAATPFELPDLAETTQLLMNYGFTADDAISKMSMLGDIAQGDSEKMKRIATAYGQMSSAGKVMLEDIKQMIEAGFNPLQEISQATGESMESLYARISAGELTVEEITASIQRSTSEGGKYFQSMEKQSKTAAGQISTLKDNFQQLAGAIAGDTSSALSEEFLPLLNEMIGTLQTAFEQGGLDGLAEAFGDSLAQLVVIAAEKIPSLMAMGSDVIASIAQGIRDNADAIFDSFLEVLMSLPGFVVENLGILLDVGSIFITKLCDGVINNADELADTAVDTVVMLGNFLIKNAPKLAKAAKELVKALAKAIGNQVPALKPFTKVIEGLADNLDTLLPIILGVVGGFKGMKIIKSITPLVSGFVTQAKNAVTQGKGLSGVLSSISNPAGVAVGVIGGLAGAVYSFVEEAKEAERTRLDEKYAHITEAAEKSAEALAQFQEEQTAIREASQEAADAVLAEDEKLSELRNELSTIVDENGKIKQGYEDRATYIYNELAGALGFEVQQIEDNVIPAYQDLQEEIDTLIDKKRNAGLLEAYEEQYNEAGTSEKQLVSDKTTAENEARRAERDVEAYVDTYQAEWKKRLEKNQLAAELNDDNFNYDEYWASYNDFQNIISDGSTESYLNALSKYGNADAKTYAEKEGEAWRAARDLAIEYQDQLLVNESIQENYEALEYAIETGAAQSEIDQLFQNLENSEYASLTNTEKTNDQKLEDTRQYLSEALTAYQVARETGDAKAIQQASDTMGVLLQIAEENGVDMGILLDEGIIDQLESIDGWDTSNLIAFAKVFGVDIGFAAGSDFKDSFERASAGLETTVKVTANVIGGLEGFLGISAGPTSNTSTTYNTTNNFTVNSAADARRLSELQAQEKSLNSQGVGK